MAGRHRRRHSGRPRRLYREARRRYLDQAAGPTEDPQTARVYESAYALTDILGRVPVHVIPCIERRFDGAPNAISAAVVRIDPAGRLELQLALRARGLGSVLTTLHLVKEREAAELLGIPADVTQVRCCRWRTRSATDFRPAARAPVETITSWDRWDVGRCRD